MEADRELPLKGGGALPVAVCLSMSRLRLY